jgi:hypothetical protein
MALIVYCFHPFTGDGEILGETPAMLQSDDRAEGVAGEWLAHLDVRNVIWSCDCISFQ